MKRNFLALAGTAALLSACSGIGDGNGPVRIEVVVDGKTDEAQAFECLASTPQALLYFSNGSVANIAQQRRDLVWSSSDESVLKVSDGTVVASEGNVFINGALLPVSEGTATLTVRYLDFYEDSIDVTVRPNTIELSPHDHTVVQGNQLTMFATGILDGESQINALDMSSLGVWSVAPKSADEAVTSIVPTTGLLTASKDVAGTDTVTFAVDFCGRSASVDVNVIDQDLASIRVVRRDDPSVDVTDIALPPDASVALSTIATYSGGHEIDVTNAVTFAVDDNDVAFSVLRGTGVVTAAALGAGQETTLTVTLDPDRSTADDEFVSDVIPVKVLNVALDPDTLAIAPTQGVMLNGSSLSFAASGTFTGDDGPVDWDLTRDVTWSSSNSEVMLVSNVNGSRGVAISSADSTDIGVVTVRAVRTSGDGPETAPEATITVGAAEAETPVLQVAALRVEADEAGASRGTKLSLRAVAEIASETLSGEQDVSNFVVWSSSDPSIAVVDNTSVARGQVTVVSDEADATVTITATYDDANQTDRVAGSLELQINPSPTN